MRLDEVICTLENQKGLSNIAILANNIHLWYDFTSKLLLFVCVCVCVCRDLVAGVVSFPFSFGRIKIQNKLKSVTVAASSKPEGSPPLHCCSKQLSNVEGREIQLPNVFEATTSIVGSRTYTGIYVSHR